MISLDKFIAFSREFNLHEGSTISTTINRAITIIIYLIAFFLKMETSHRLQNQQGQT